MKKINTTILSLFFSESRVLLLASLTCIAFHTWLAWIGTVQGSSSWTFALIEGSNLLGIDDAYRYFLSFYAFKEIAIYTWDYVLPVATFFFGVITLIVNDNIFAGRVIVLLVNMTGYYALYRSLRLTGANLWPSTISILIIAFMPVQSIMSISYYGEALLFTFTAFAMLCYLKKLWLACALLASLLPLIRPEGIFLLAPFSIYFLIKKQYIYFITSGLSGFLFYLFISYHSGVLTLSLLLDWRLEIRSIWKTFIMPNTYNNFGMFSTYNALWIVGAHAGFFLPSLRKHWPLWSGSILWSVFYTGMVVTGMSSYESRYFAACYPAFVMGFAFFIQYFLNKRKTGTYNYWPAAGLLIASFVFIEHFLQYDPLKARFGAGSRWPINQVPVIHDNFTPYSEEQIISLQLMAKTIGDIIEQHQEIDTLMVFEWPILYFLKREIIDSGIKLQFAPIPQEVTTPSTGGSFFTYSQYGRKFRYYNPTDIRQQGIDGIALYVGSLKMPYMNPVYHFGPYPLNIIGYHDYETPNWRYKGEIHIR